MTQYARVVLQDCEAALQDLRSGATGQTFRLRWVAAVALLRAVGYVLDKVNSQTDPAMKDAVRCAYEAVKRTKPELQIYWEFIDKERHNVVNLHRFGALEHVTLTPGTGHVNLTTGEPWGSPSEPTWHLRYRIAVLQRGTIVECLL